MNKLICKVFGHTKHNEVYYGVPEPDRPGATLIHEYTCNRCLTVIKEPSTKIFANYVPAK